MSRLIADACSNHNGDRSIMEEMIKQASLSGVDIIKFQSFTADKLNKSWPDYENALKYYKSVQLSDEDHLFILDKCKEYNIEPLFTAFDLERAKFLRKIGMGRVKIASPDADNKYLVKFCKENFYCYISTGMCSYVNGKSLRYNHDKIFYCISEYPLEKHKVNFNLMREYDGFSDHTPDLDCAKQAIDMHMDYIERHYTLDKNMPGKDHKFSSTPDEFKELCQYRDKVNIYKKRWV